MSPILGTSLERRSERRNRRCQPGTRTSTRILSKRRYWRLAASPGQCLAIAPRASQSAPETPPDVRHRFGAPSGKWAYRAADGGLIGYVTGVNITNSYSHVDVTGTEAGAVIAVDTQEQHADHQWRKQSERCRGALYKRDWHIDRSAEIDARHHVADPIE